MNWTRRASIALVALALTCAAEWFRPGLVHRLDEGLRDAFIRLVADQQPEDRLVVVDIDEAALGEFGPWPWPRQRMADLAEILLGPCGARAVGLDMVFPDPGDAAGDARLASLAAHAPLTLAQVLDYSPRSPALLQGVLAGGGLTSQVAMPSRLMGSLLTMPGCLKPVAWAT